MPKLTKRQKEHTAGKRRRGPPTKLRTSLGERPPRKGAKKRLSSDPALEKALRYLRFTNNQKRAAQGAGVSVKRFRRFLQRSKVAKFKGRRWHFNDRRRRKIVAITTTGERELIVRGFEPASWAMSHRNAVREFRDTGDISLLKPFEGVSITDNRGKNHDLEARPNVLYRLAATGGEPYEQIYKLLT